MSAQPCGCDPECEVPEYDIDIVTDQSEIAGLTLIFHTCDEFPECAFGRGFIVGAFMKKDDE